MRPSEQTGAGAGRLRLYAHHERSFEDHRYVYPVISRRSQGLSIGVNLNPDKICNFDCVYCQVDRRIPGETHFVGLAELLRELETLLRLGATGALFERGKFRETPPALRRLNDIAFSGDGEPTTHRNIDEVVAACAALKRRLGLDTVRMVLITNASMFHRPHVREALKTLDANQGEIWAKLEAGTEAYFRLIDRTPIPFRQIVGNIAAAAQVRPIVIQSLFLRFQGAGPPTEELEAYCERLNEIAASGGQIRLVQVYTVARRPADPAVQPLADREVDAIVRMVRERTGLDACGYYGQASEASDSGDSE
jgi:wyosine [tRNA(Phe)-imidazoG37] synthetase (radical SAM superfamily)